VNTSDGSSNISGFQSNGLCYDHCNGGSFAFAILQGQACWCSDYVPETTTDGCDDPCPGYPPEKCGNTDQNLYAYMALPNKPSGTMGADSTTSTKTSVTTKSSAKTTKSSNKATPTRGSIMVTTVVAGGFKTVVISATGSAVPKATAEAQSKDDDFFSNAGRAAGLIVGLILALFLIVAGVLFYRRRQSLRRSALYAPGSTGGIIPAGGAGFFGSGRRGRSMSTLGLVGEKSPPASTTPPDHLSGTVALTPHTAGGTTPQVGAIYDPRLDPGSLFMRFDHQTGSSRMSVRSLRDDQDYSRRVLRLANPDEH